MLSNLADGTCTPCRAGTPPLTPEAFEPLLQQLSGWEVEDGKKIGKSYRFKDFVEAVAFVDAIVPLAEGEGHHPDLFVKWGAVRVYLSTHAAGGLTDNDFVMAAKIDRMHGERSTA
jgi:pterin-4a-carbinolamine dehydratase